MKVILISHTPNPEKTVAAAARLCYSPATVERVLDGMTDEKAAGFVSMLSEIGHESPIEHATFTFGIEGVSRSLLAQITRHRIASFSVQSQRYVNENCFEYVIPPEIEADPEAKECYIKAMDRIQDDYDKLTDILKQKHYKIFLEKGQDEKTATRNAEKKAIEDARFVLPNACTTKMMLTMNARSLHNFFAHRCCYRAQWEIRNLAKEMLKLVLEVAPNLFSKAGPPCLNGPCPEGKMSCGNTKDVREEYARLKNVL